MKSPVERRLWRCSSCERTYMIPASARNPKVCPRCKSDIPQHTESNTTPAAVSHETAAPLNKLPESRQDPRRSDSFRLRLSIQERRALFAAADWLGKMWQRFIAFRDARPWTTLTCGFAAALILLIGGGITITWLLEDSSSARQVVQPQGRSLSAGEVFAKASPSVVRVEVRDSQFRLIGQGSGFLVSEDGLIATNHHVVQSAYFAHVIQNDGTKFPVEGVAALDRDADLALLQIKGMQLPVLKVATTDLPQVGARVYAIGNPKGLINSLSDGLISGHRKQDDDVTLIQTTVPISPGSSGGPLLSDDGSVVGVIVSSFQGGQNLNLAVPTARLLLLINSRGKLKTLASAGANPLKAGEARKLDQVWAAIKIKDHAKALELLSAIRASQQGSAAYWYSVGYVYIGLGNHELAIPALQRAISLNPTEVDSHVLLGTSYSNLRRHREAIAAWNSAILLDPKRSDIFSLVAKAHLLFGRPESAVGAFRSAVALNPNDAGLYKGLALACRLSGQYQKSIDAYKSALLINPKDDLAYFELGIAYDMSGQVQQAISSFESALALNPGLTDARFNLHVAYWNTKELRKAVKHMVLLTELDPDSELGRLAKDKLDLIRKLQRKGWSLEEIHTAFESNKFESNK